MSTIYNGDPDLREKFQRLRELASVRWKRDFTAEEQAEDERIKESIKGKGGMGSQYYKHAASFSKSADSYWTRPHELFARAFESYIEDTLEAQGRKSSYLVAGTRQKYRTGRFINGEAEKKGEHSQIYPQGEERKAINKVIGELVKVLAEEKALEKALRALAGHLPRFYLPADTLRGSRSRCKFELRKS